MLNNGFVQLLVLLSCCHDAFTTGAKSRIFGGVILKTETRQYLVKLKINVTINGESLRKICSGSVINDQWVISAAHCFRYGVKEDVAVEYFEEGKFITGHVRPDEVKLHPKYDENKSIYAAKHDIALLKMQSKLKRDVIIKLSEEVPIFGQVGAIAGYGENENKRPGPNEGTVVIENKWNVLSSIGKVWAGHGDSGGPLVTEKLLIGVISRGKCHKDKCITYYADIYSNLNWIKRTMHN